MTREEFDELRESISGLFDKWLWVVDHYGWKFEVKYYGTWRDLPEDVEKEAAMTVFSDWSRLSAVIHVHLEECNRDRDKIEEMVVHELVHMLLDPVDDEAETNQIELSVTWVTRLLLGAFK